MTEPGLASSDATNIESSMADGPDEVHREQIGKLELARHAGAGPPGSVGAR
jgi:hypothetical protein